MGLGPPWIILLGVMVRRAQCQPLVRSLKLTQVALGPVDRLVEIQGAVEEGHSPLLEATLLAQRRVLLEQPVPGRVVQVLAVEAESLAEGVEAGDLMGRLETGPEVLLLAHAVAVPVVGLVLVGLAFLAVTVAEASTDPLNSRLEAHRLQLAILELLQRRPW